MTSTIGGLISGTSLYYETVVKLHNDDREIQVTDLVYCKGKNAGTVFDKKGQVSACDRKNDMIYIFYNHFKPKKRNINNYV